MFFTEIDFIPYNLFHTIYLTVVMMACIMIFFHYISSSGNKILYNQGGPLKLIPASVLCVALIFLIGLRPASRFVSYFGDTFYYAHFYNNILIDYTDVDWSGEWIWENFSFFLKSIALNVNEYLLVVAAIYIILMFVCCIKLMKNNVLIAVLFCLASFSFWGYGINGIRNGMACSIVLLAVSFLPGNTIEKIISILLMVIAYGIHHSILLPGLCAVMAYVAIKDPKYAISFWGISILISLVAGNLVGDFFASLGFDERTSYFTDTDESSLSSDFSSTGFRFDFLLYSAMPVLMTWYVAVKRKFKDSTFNLIANTYILSNAFWVMVIRATFSNRFAYLSWFLYPIVIAYPLLRMNIWEDQDRKTVLILLAYSGFTLFMSLIGK